ncbi:MAG: UDP-N-acetylmuramoyl-tripeptide--D-alanyl-D-alanine ligase [Candidatus Pacebacteria bacterium]|nr:UDP-N-acetylmuramoyl-tripeptide--D-alanyl-D-alanine ligase [Candidatus Paceibacterota bacterium]
METKGRTLKRPKPTFKVILILFTSLSFYIFITAVCYINGNLSLVFTILLLLVFYLATPLLITAVVLTVNPIFNFQKRRIIKKATQKMRTLKKVKVIGITGSYGKTSTKEFLDTILSEKFKVVKTEGNNNTNIGVAYTVLNKVSDEYDYFICEMGAYKIGEIAEMCEIVKPQIGILTGINEQHIELFGSIENTMKAKFELIESLPENGLAIINARITNYESRIIKKNVKRFSLDDAENIKVCRDCIEFNYKNHNFKINLLGRHFIENLLAAIMTAEDLGMSLEEISRAVEKIKPSEFMMRKLKGVSNSVFINDSYSANPDGVVAALDSLNEAYQDCKKIIVFPGIIELGSESEKVHKRLFDKIDKICDIAYILNTEYQTPNVKYKCKFVFEKDFGKVASILKKELDENTIVLFESRGAGVVMKKLLK